MARNLTAFKLVGLQLAHWLTPDSPVLPTYLRTWNSYESSMELDQKQSGLSAMHANRKPDSR